MCITKRVIFIVLGKMRRLSIIGLVIFLMLILGFTANVLMTTLRYMDGLEAVPVYRIRTRPSWPNYREEVASLVAERHGLDVGHLTPTTLINSCHMYGIDLSG